MWLPGFFGTSRLGEWLDVMFGQPQPGQNRHGALATFFQHLGRGFSHVKFSEKSIHPDDVLTPISEEEIDRVYNWAFTQYYPHEHVDYPPSQWMKDLQRSRLYKPLNRKLLGYLEEQIQFISEELSKIELEWVRNRHLAADDPVRLEKNLDV